MSWTLLFVICVLPVFPVAAVNWTLVWSDEFNDAVDTKPDPSKWGYHIGDGSGHGIPGWGNSELQYYTDRVENVAQDGTGSLVITATREGASGHRCYYGACQYTSSRLFTGGKFAHQYGRFEARLKTPTGKGLWPAFWMLGDNYPNVGWPKCGEIDVMELRGSKPGTVSGALHGLGFSGGSAVGASHTLPGGQSFADDFHTFAVDWEPDAVTWSVDDVAYHRQTRDDLRGKTWIFDHPFYILLNLAVGGHFDGNPGNDTAFPQSLVVDYIRVYRDGDGAAPSEGGVTAAPVVAGNRKWQQRGVGSATPRTTLKTAKGKHDAFSKLEAESADEQRGTSTEETQYGHGDQIVNHVGNGDMLVYRKVDFGSGADGVQIRYASGVPSGVTGIVRFHLDDPSTHYFALFGIGNSGGWQKWRTMHGSVSPTPSGIHDLYVIFQSDYKDYFASVNWFTFTDYAP